MLSTTKVVVPIPLEDGSPKPQEPRHREHRWLRRFGIQILLAVLIATAILIAAWPILSDLTTAPKATSSIESTPSNGSQVDRTGATVPSSPNVAPLPSESAVAAESPELAGIEVEVWKTQGVGVDRISVRNRTAATLDVSNWRVEPAIGSVVFTVPEGIAIKSGGTLTIYEMSVIGLQCPADTALALFTCNALGLREATHDVIFRSFASVLVVDENGTVVAESG